MYPIDYDEPQFLEPAHSHDPFQVSDLTALPTSVTETMLLLFQEALNALQECTSVAFASSRRLQNLAGDRFNRLGPAVAEQNSNPVQETGDISCTASSLAIYMNYADECNPDSEPAFFTYTNQLRAEKRYLLEEIPSDWRHKAARVLHENRKCETEVALHGKEEIQADFKTWWRSLRAEVDTWFEEAEDTAIPDFEDTVAEHRLFEDQKIMRGLVKAEQHQREVVLEPDLPEPKVRKRAETMDSGIGMGYNSGTEEWELPT